MWNKIRSLKLITITNSLHFTRNGWHIKYKLLSDAKAIVSKEMSGKMQLWYLITLHAVSVSVTLNIDSYNNTSQNE